MATVVIWARLIIRITDTEASLVIVAMRRRSFAKKKSSNPEKPPKAICDRGTGEWLDGLTDQTTKHTGRVNGWTI